MRIVFKKCFSELKKKFGDNYEKILFDSPNKIVEFIIRNCLKEYKKFDV